MSLSVAGVRWSGAFVKLLTFFVFFEVLPRAEAFDTSDRNDNSKSLQDEKKISKKWDFFRKSQKSPGTFLRFFET